MSVPKHRLYMRDILSATNFSGIKNFFVLTNLMIKVISKQNSLFQCIDFNLIFSVGNNYIALSFYMRSKFLPETTYL
jgi:hypothetical protein